MIGGADLIICGRQTTDGDTAQVGPALYSAVLYFFFQLASVSVMYQHMEDVTDEKQINKAAIWMFVCNFCAMELSILGLLAIAYVGELASASVPMLVLVQNGVGSGILTPIISLLIILGAISTAVKYDLRYRNTLRKRSRTPYGQPGEKISGTSWKKCYFHSNLHISGICHRTVWSDDSCQKVTHTLDMRHLSHCLYRL